MSFSARITKLESRAVASDAPRARGVRFAKSPDEARFYELIEHDCGVATADKVFGFYAYDPQKHPLKNLMDLLAIGGNP